jgi:hypothetical protein
VNDVTPPIVLDDGLMFDSVEQLRSYYCYPTDVSAIRAAFDALGHRIRLSAESDETPIAVSVDPETRPDELHAMLREIVGGRAVRFGLIGGDASIDGLLRAIWRRHHREPYPRDIDRR